MKKNSEDILRLKSLLAKNKFGSDEKFEHLFYGDLCGVLKDYFEISGDPLVNIEKSQGGYSVSVAFNAAAIRKVNSITDCP